MADTHARLYGSAAEVGRITGLNPKAVPGVAARGLIRAIQIPGHRIKYSLEDARCLAAACTTAPLSPVGACAAPALSTVAQSA